MHRAATPRRIESAQGMVLYSCRQRSIKTLASSSAALLEIRATARQNIGCVRIHCGFDPRFGQQYTASAFSRCLYLFDSHLPPAGDTLE